MPYWIKDFTNGFAGNGQEVLETDEEGRVVQHLRAWDEPGVVDDRFVPAGTGSKFEPGPEWRQAEADEEREIEDWLG